MNVGFCLQGSKAEENSAFMLERSEPWSVPRGGREKHARAQPTLGSTCCGDPPQSLVLLAEAFVPILTPRHCPSTQPGPCPPGAPAWAVDELRGGALATTKSPAALLEGYSQITHRTDLFRPPPRGMTRDWFA